jgi:hypothetical protein
VGGGAAGGSASLPDCLSYVAAGSASPATAVPLSASLIVAPDGTPVSTAVQAQVTVSAIDIVPPGADAGVANPTIDSGSSDSGSSDSGSSDGGSSDGGSSTASDAGSAGPGVFRIHLQTATQQEWLVDLKTTRAIADIVQVSDRFDLSVAAVNRQQLYSILSQSWVLSQGGRLALFSSMLGALATPRQTSFSMVPMLDAYGISVSDGGALCETPVAGYNQCDIVYHRAHITSDGQSADVPLGQTAQIGDLTVSVWDFTEFGDTGSCDGESRTIMAGYRPRAIAN